MCFFIIIFLNILKCINQANEQGLTVFEFDELPTFGEHAFGSIYPGVP